MIKEVTDINFETEVKESNDVVVADFWAPWCGPCKMIAPVMEELERQLGAKAKFVKINVDENPVLSQSFGIASIPTIMVFKNGEVKETVLGFRPKQDLQNVIERNL